MKPDSFIEKFIQSPIVQAVVIFVSGGWIILEITEYFIENFGLNESARNILLIILVSAFPVAIFLSWYLSKKQRDSENTGPREQAKQPSTVPESRYKRIIFSLRKPQYYLPGLLIIVAIVISLIFRFQHQSKIQYAIDNSIPSLQNEFDSLINHPYEEENWIVYNRAAELRKNIKENPDLDKVWYGTTIPLSFNTNPDGAKVYAKPYSKPDTSWYFIGKTPLEGFPFPRGLSRVKIEKAGYKTQDDVILKPFGWQNEADTIHYQLFKASEVPENMVHVPGLTSKQSNLFISSFWMDCYEVTNKEYKTFMDAGGYTDSSFWNFPFILEEDTIFFNDAKERFIDNTGWIGPANWELGEFPRESDNLPVTGISWYEASAYAKYVNKSLPTIHHWFYVSEKNAAPEIVKFGNYNRNGPVEKGTYNSMTRFGTYDLPGNVSEWIYNSTGNDRFIIGGNYKEPSYLYNTAWPISPWSRNELTGFRCIRYIDDKLKQQLTRSFDQIKRNYQDLKPVSDEIFQVYKELLGVEKTELNAITISTSENEDWIQEIISINVPYEDAPLKILVFLPVNYTPPYQSILYFPGIDAHYSSSMTDMNADNRFDFFLKSGRAVIWPVYYSSYGRGDINITNVSRWKQTYKNIITDVQFVCDYLQTRDDIDSDKLAFYGYSWGGAVASYILAIEERINLGILALFGVSSINKYRFKEFDQIDYIPHVKIPMLLLGGRYDPDYTLEQQQSFYDFLGTPKSDVKWVVYETTHWVPRKDLINESLSWLDRYFGPVNK